MRCVIARTSGGTPVVGWVGTPRPRLVTQGEPKVYASSKHGRPALNLRQCKTGLLYVNDSKLPGIIGVQSGIFDDPDAVIQIGMLTDATLAGIAAKLYYRLSWVAHYALVALRHTSSRFRCIDRFCKPDAPPIGGEVGIQAMACDRIRHRGRSHPLSR